MTQTQSVILVRHHNLDHVLELVTDSEPIVNFILNTLKLNVEEVRPGQYCFALPAGQLSAIIAAQTMVAPTVQIVLFDRDYSGNITESELLTPSVYRPDGELDQMITQPATITEPTRWFPGFELFPWQQLAYKIACTYDRSTILTDECHGRFTLMKYLLRACSGRTLIICDSTAVAKRFDGIVTYLDGQHTSRLDPAKSYVCPLSSLIRFGRERFDLVLGLGLAGITDRVTSYMDTVRFRHAVHIMSLADLNRLHTLEPARRTQLVRWFGPARQLDESLIAYSDPKQLTRLDIEDYDLAVMKAGTGN